MRNARQREWSNEDVDAYEAAHNRNEKIAKAADEEGGPQLSLVPAVVREHASPTDLLPPATDPAAPVAADAPAGPPAAEPPAAEPFDGIPLTDSRRRAGWSAARQRVFLTALAETGSVHLASATGRLSARSAYALRARSPVFAAAWDTAEQLAVGRLSALAFDRAINGRTEQLWKQGELVAEKRLPSDRMLMWLLARLDPRRFASAWEKRGDTADPQTAPHLAFPAQLADLADVPAS